MTEYRERSGLARHQPRAGSRPEDRGRTRYRRRAGSIGSGQEAAIRALDITVSLIALLALAPLFLLLWVLVRATSPGPMLFAQERVGRGRRPFTLLKLRTMYSGNDDQIHREYVASLMSDDAPQPGGDSGLYKLDADPRITPVGAWLRKTSLDELPQLVNVLRGEMSLVGPRPVLTWEADLLRANDRRRFEVRPGLTGLWQVSGRSRLPMREALALDIEYVRRRSLAFDLLILLRTIPALLRGGAT